MTLTVKNSPELNSPGKPGASSPNSENKAGQSPRSNPVCLEVGVTIRSLPTEASGSTQPIREEGRTVIVFDNGAVLRSAQNLPVGQKIIVSNPRGRDVVCQVVGGRNMPSIKGYVEVEFLEPVNDFWSIHQDLDPVAVAAPSTTPVTPQGTPVPSTPAFPTSPRAASTAEATARPASEPLGSAPSFEDIPGLASTLPTTAATRGSKTVQARPSLEKTSADASDYNHSEITSPTSVANWRPQAPEQETEKRAIPATREAPAAASPAPAAPRDFMSKGLMAYEQPGSSQSGSNGRVPLIVGVSALALAGVCAVVFVMHRGSTPVPAAKAPVVSQQSTPEPPIAKSAPEPVKAAQEETPPAAAQTQPVAVDEPQPMVAVAPVPAVVTSPATTDTRTDSRNVRRQEKNAIATKQPELSTLRRPAIPNLKMGSPSAPNQKLANVSEGTAPNPTETASAEAVAVTPPAGLLTSAGRTSIPPTPPPSAPAPAAPAPVSATKTLQDPKLISTTRPSYPQAARQANIQGSVSVSAMIDEKGKVVSAKALSGPLLLRQAAEESVRQWRYSPGLLDGKPAPSEVTVGVDFRLTTPR